MSESSQGAQIADSPLKAYGLTAEEQASIDFAEDKLISDCMAESGFSYPTEPFFAVLETWRSNDAQGKSRLYGITDASVAANYGYDLPPEALAPAGPPDGERDESEASLVALVGAGSAKNTRAGEPMSEPGGCMGEAREKLKFTAQYVPDGLPGSGGKGTDDLSEALSVQTALEFTASEEWTGLTKNWVDCMADKGWHVTDPLFDNGDIKSITDDRGLKGSPVSDREKRLAVDDVACKVSTDFVNRAKAANDVWDQKVLEQNLPALQESRQHLNEVVAVANSVVERAG